MWRLFVDIGNYYYSYLFLFDSLSFVVTSREENKSYLLIQCIFNLMVTFVIEISASVLGISKYTNKNTRRLTLVQP